MKLEIQFLLQLNGLVVIDRLKNVKTNNFVWIFKTIVYVVIRSELNTVH